ncbi:plasmid mobilization protein [Flavitalea flava]
METVRMKKKKGGRPPKKLKRELRITARFSKLEHYILQQKAGKAGINVSEFLRQAAITCKVTARLTEEERNAIRQLIGMANNLNQMAKVANREGMGSIRLLLEGCLLQVHGLLNKLQHGE